MRRVRPYEALRKFPGSRILRSYVLRNLQAWGILGGGLNPPSITFIFFFLARSDLIPKTEKKLDIFFRLSYIRNQDHLLLRYYCYYNYNAILIQQATSLRLIILILVYIVNDSNKVRPPLAHTHLPSHRLPPPPGLTLTRVW